MSEFVRMDKSGWEQLSSTRHLTVVEVIRGFWRVVDKTSIEFRHFKALLPFAFFPPVTSASEGVKSDLLLGPEDHCKMDVIIIIVWFTECMGKISLQLQRHSPQFLKTTKIVSYYLSCQLFTLFLP